MAHTAAPFVRGRSVAAALALVVAVSIGSIAVAPSAWAGHSDVTASVECVDGERILDWSWTAFRHTSTDELPGFVAVEYTEGGDPVVVRTTTLIDVPHLTTGTTTLAPPTDATQVRVHVYAYWTGTTDLIDWLDARTGWLALPAPCEAQQTVVTSPEEPDDTTSTTGETTTTTSGNTAGTTATTDPPAAVNGVSGERPAAVASAQAVPAQVVSAQAVSAQAAPNQTLPNTGSSTGVLAAGAAMMIAIGGGLVATSRRSLHAITVSSDDTPGAG